LGVANDLISGGLCLFSKKLAFAALQVTLYKLKAYLTSRELVNQGAETSL
jgi:hypothetical protein